MSLYFFLVAPDPSHPSLFNSGISEEFQGPKALSLLCGMPPGAIVSLFSLPLVYCYTIAINMACTHRFWDLLTIASTFVGKTHWMIIFLPLPLSRDCVTSVSFLSLFYLWYFVFHLPNGTPAYSCTLSPPLTLALTLTLPFFPCFW
jgi:hypothetical protein